MALKTLKIVENQKINIKTLKKFVNFLVLNETFERFIKHTNKKNTFFKKTMKFKNKLTNSKALTNLTDYSKLISLPNSILKETFYRLIRII